jgi:hypothetical protein
MTETNSDVAGRHAVASKAALWAGWVISVLPVLLMLFSASLKLSKVPAAVEGFGKFGYGEHLLLPLGIVEVCCALIYLIPRTAILGAILVTGYLDGAAATHVRVNDPSFVMPILLGVIAWLGL